MSKAKERETLPKKNKRKRKPAKATIADSMTIPGQEVSARELVEKMAGGTVVAGNMVRRIAYSGDVMVNDYNSIDITHKMEKLEIYNKEIELLKKNKKDKAALEEREKLRDEVKAELEAELQKEPPPEETEEPSS